MLVLDKNAKICYTDFRLIHLVNFMEEMIRHMRKRKNLLVISIVCASVLLILFIGAICIYISARTDAKDNLYDALKLNNHQTVAEILDQYPGLVNEDYYVHPFYFLWEGSDSSPLLHAIRYGDLPMVELLVEKGASVNKRVGKSCPLNRALGQQKYDIAWYLIETGANLSTQSEIWGEETVPLAILAKPIDISNAQWDQVQLDLLKYVLEHGAPLNPKNRPMFGIETLLGKASYSNNALAVQYLLDEQIYNVDDVVDSENNMRTALIIAVEEQSYEACRVLLNYGANKNIRDSFGKRAIDYARELEDQRLIAMLND